MIRAQAGHVDIVPAVIVVIADRHAHAPSDVADPGFVRHIGKRSVTVVVIEDAARFLLWLHHVHGQRVNEIDVQIAIVVVVKKRHTSAHRLYDVFFLGWWHMLELDAGLICDVDEMHVDSLSVGHPCGRSQDQDQE